MAVTRIKKKRGKFYPQYKVFLFWCNFTYVDLSQHGAEHNERGVYRFESKQDALDFIEGKRIQSENKKITNNIMCRKDTDSF